MGNQSGVDVIWSFFDEGFCDDLLGVVFLPLQVGDVAFSVPNSLVVTLERVLGNETVGNCAMFLFFGLDFVFLLVPLLYKGDFL